MVGIAQALEKIAPLFEIIDLRVPSVPACFSVALPTPHALHDIPGFPPAALPGRGRMASGRGLDAETCRASCLGEAVELISCCAWGDEDVVTASAAELGDTALHPQTLLGLSDHQYAGRQAWNAAMGSFDWRPRPYPASRPIDWMEIRDAFTGRVFHAPADIMLIGRREAGDEEAVGIADSNGCASAGSLEQARLSACLELIERDAVSRWWYGQRGRNAVDLADIHSPAALLEFLHGRNRRTVLFDISSDLAVPVYAAVSAEQDGSDVAIGSVASPDADAAANSALTEMLQMEVSLDMARRAPGSAGAWDIWRKEVTMATPPLCLAAPARTMARPFEGIDRAEWLSVVLAACEASGVSLYFADMTRPSLGVPVIRCLSAHLCHYKPRFDRARLLALDARDCTRSDESLHKPNARYLLV